MRGGSVSRRVVSKTGYRLLLIFFIYIMLYSPYCFLLSSKGQALICTDADLLLKLTSIWDGSRNEPCGDTVIKCAFHV